MKIKASEAFYQALFERALDGLVYGHMVFNAHGRPIDLIYRKVNKTFETLMGLHGAVGMRATKLTPGMAASNPEFLEIFGRVSLTNKPERFEMRVEPLARWFLISVYSPEKKSIVAVFQDITYRKQIEQNLENAKVAAHNVLDDLGAEKSKAEALAKDLEKFKLAVASTSEHVVITDPEGAVLFVNPAAERTTGFAQEEILGKKAGGKELWGGLMNNEFYRELWQTIKIEKQSFSRVIKNRRKNGQEYYAHTTISPILNQKGEVEFFVGIERDITKEKEVDRAKSEFVSLASHQLRTPTTAIRWYSEMLLGAKVGALNEKQKEYLREIHHGNQRMIDLMNTLLSASRIELDTLAIKAESTDLGAIADDILKELQAQVSEKELVIERTDEKNISLIKTDPKLVRIIFQNLIANAIAYTPKRGTVSIMITKTDTGVHLEVGDNGYGIPQDARSKIYTKFFRADNARIIQPDGTGLGLYITKSITEALGGTIDFRSVEGQGTTFSVNIPTWAIAKKE